MIPKVIHYCWFGGNPLPTLAIKCIDSWKRMCPDYKICEWNEENFDLHCCDYVKEAYEEKMWAFVSDYARLKIIYENGGIYLDTDVELVKSLDVVIEEECFLPMETTHYINTGLGFGAKKNNAVVKEMLDVYSDLHFRLSNGVTDLLPCPRRNTKPFMNTEFEPYSKVIQHIKGATIYLTEYFCPMDFETHALAITENTISIHHYSTTWLSENEKINAEKVKTTIVKYGKLGGFICKMHFQYHQQYEKISLGNLIRFAVLKVRVKITREKIKKENTWF